VSLFFCFGGIGWVVCVVGSLQILERSFIGCCGKVETCCYEVASEPKLVKFHNLINNRLINSNFGTKQPINAVFFCLLWWVGCVLLEVFQILERSFASCPGKLVMFCREMPDQWSQTGKFSEVKLII
jgi:hypothetical protein